MMKTKKLVWKYMGLTNAHWVGMLPGEYPPVRFVLEKLSGERYLIKSDLDGIENCSCTGLESAKLCAQELFNGYVHSLLEVNGNNHSS